MNRWFLDEFNRWFEELVINVCFWFLGAIRWPVKSPDPSAVRAQEPKTRVVPLGTLLASFDSAIGFVSELAESPT